MRLVLASASPRRKELMELLEMPFEIIKSSVEEVITKTEPDEVVKELSLQKAGDVLKTLTDENPHLEDVLVIGADTVVSVDGKILGKPADEEDAFRMLRLLSGRTHQVYTGVTLLYRGADGLRTESFAEKTDVHFSELSDMEIRHYIATKEPMDKAGSYGIQGYGSKYIHSINGDYFNVVGLPLSKIYKWITSFS